MKLLHRAAHWALDHAMLILFAAGAAALVYHGMTRAPAKYLKAPVQFCTSASTGQVRESSTTTMQCVSRARNGTCSAWVPNTTHRIKRQARVTCDWLEWR